MLNPNQRKFYLRVVQFLFLVSLGFYLGYRCRDNKALLRDNGTIEINIMIKK